jgi:hypothetical protein
MKSGAARLDPQGDPLKSGAARLDNHLKGTS